MQVDVLYFHSLPRRPSWKKFQISRKNDHPATCQRSDVTSCFIFTFFDVVLIGCYFSFPLKKKPHNSYSRVSFKVELMAAFKTNIFYLFSLIFANSYIYTSLLFYVLYIVSPHVFLLHYWFFNVTDGTVTGELQHFPFTVALAATLTKKTRIFSLFPSFVYLHRLSETSGYLLSTIPAFCHVIYPTKFQAWNNLVMNQDTDRRWHG